MDFAYVLPGHLKKQYMTNEKRDPPSESNPGITPDMGALAGTRIITSEEKKEKLLDDDEKEPESPTDSSPPSGSDEGNVSPEEQELLERAADFMPTEDEEGLQDATLDDTDAEGDPLNENNEDVSGRDLDIPGSERDDMDEDIGEEDEENNSYSLGGDTHD